jgi:hypothetical protein
MAPCVQQVSLLLAYTQIEYANLSTCTPNAFVTSQDVAAELAAIPAVPHGAVAVHRPRQNSSSGGVAFTVGGNSSCNTPATARSAIAAAAPMTSLAAAAAARQARRELGHNLGMSPHRSDSSQIVTSYDDVAPERDPDVWPPPTPDPSGSAAANNGRRGSSGGSGSGAGNNRVLPWASRGDEQGERGGSGPGKMLFNFNTLK